RRFPRAVGAEQSGDRSLGDLEIEAVERDDVGEGSAHTLDLNDRLRHAPTISAAPRARLTPTGEHESTSNIEASDLPDRRFVLSDYPARRCPTSEPAMLSVVSSAPLRISEFKYPAHAISASLVGKSSLKQQNSSESSSKRAFSISSGLLPATNWSYSGVPRKTTSGKNVASVKPFSRRICTVRMWDSLVSPGRPAMNVRIGSISNRRASNAPSSTAFDVCRFNTTFSRISSLNDSLPNARLPKLAAFILISVSSSIMSARVC